MSNVLRTLVETATQQFTQILSVKEIKDQYPLLYWGGNGVGDRWANKMFNYTVIFGNGKTKLYSENDDDTVPQNILLNFLMFILHFVLDQGQNGNQTSTIICIYYHTW